MSLAKLKTLLISFYFQENHLHITEVKCLEISAQIGVQPCVSSNRAQQCTLNMQNYIIIINKQR